MKTSSSNHAQGMTLVEFSFFSLILIALIGICFVAAQNWSEKRRDEKQKELDEQFEKSQEDAAARKRVFSGGYDLQGSETP